MGETPTAYTVATAAGVTDYNNVPQGAASAGHDYRMTYNLSIGSLQVGPFSTAQAAQHWAETRGFDDWTLVKVADPCEALCVADCFSCASSASAQSAVSL